MRGKLFVVSGPSGVGKNTLLNAVVARSVHVRYSISATSRAMRPGEVDGKSYYFVTREQFEKLIADDALLEYAEYVNNYYGTSLKMIQEKLNAGIDVLLDIEVQGAAKVRARCPEAIFIFIIPPSFEELSRRLHNRNTDNEDVIAGRLEKAKIEFREIPTYDYLVINDKVSNAVEEIEAILVANECRVDNRRNILKGEFSL